MLKDEADYVIVGTGAGGATAARVLAAAGHSVVMLEEGSYLRAHERPRELLEALRLALRDFGAQTTSGMTPMSVLQGRCVGGSTAINSGIIWRLPEDVRTDWIARFGLDDLMQEQALGDVFDQLDDELNVHETEPELRGGNAAKMALACEKLGLPGKPISRNTRDCKGRARCLQGCPGEARQSMDVSYVPRALRDGARLHTSMRASQVRTERGRAVGVVGDVLDPHTRRAIDRFEVRARRGVIIAAGVIHTPLVLWRTGLRGLVGERFQAHPGAAIVGRFDEPVRMGFGAVQGYEVPMRAQGFKLEVLTLPPETLAARLPGAGPAWQEKLAHLDHFAQWNTQVRMRTHGRVRPGWGGPSIRFEMTKWDTDKIKESIALLCRMMFATGAREVYPGVAGVPEVLTDVSEVALVDAHDMKQGDFHTMASHLFGTACAGSDPKRSVVGPDLASHEVRDLFVMDASVFPTNLGVNPQHSIMAVVWQAAAREANRERARATA